MATAVIVSHPTDSRSALRAAPRVDTGEVAGRNVPSARWTVLLLAVALAASAVVAYALIRQTGSSSTAEAALAGPTSAAPPLGSIGPATASGLPARPSPATSTVDGASAAAPPVVLPGAGLALPVAWSGTADVTITVGGECAAGGASTGSSTYTVPANLAIDAPKVGSGGPDDNPVSLTLGVNPAGLPGLSVFSAALDDSGALHRYWRLSATPGADGRTVLEGNMVEDRASTPGPALNLLSDSETDLQPCEAGGAVGLPRALAPGSLLSGWVSADAASLTVTGATVDGERSVTVVVTAARSA